MEGQGLSCGIVLAGLLRQDVDSIRGGALNTVEADPLLQSLCTKTGSLANRFESGTPEPSIGGS